MAEAEQWGRGARRRDARRQCGSATHLRSQCLAEVLPAVRTRLKQVDRATSPLGAPAWQVAGHEDQQELDTAFGQDIGNGLARLDTTGSGNVIEDERWHSVPR